MTNDASVALNSYTLQIPQADLSFFKAFVKKMGWKATKQKAPKPRLYDPETGDYLNDETMKVIEDARKGKGIVEVGNFDDYLKLVSRL